jgi:multiple sugar transport system permease protein
MAPALIVLALLSIFPFIYIIAHEPLAGRADRRDRPALGRAGQLDAAVQRLPVGAAWIRSIVYFVLTVGLEMLLGIAIALLVHGWSGASNWSLSLLLMPMFMAPVIVGLLGRFLTDSTYGLYAWVLRETHIYTGDILGTPTSGVLAVTLMDVWEWTPLIALIVLAGLSSLPKPVLEAARVDGASYWQRPAPHRLPDDHGRRDRRAARALDGRHPLLRHHLQHDQRRARRTRRRSSRSGSTRRLPLLRPRLRGRHRPLDAGGLDPDREPVHADAQEAGAGAMKGGRIGSKVLVAIVLLWTLVPLLWMLLSSLKPAEDLTATTPKVAVQPHARPLPRPVRRRQRHRQLHRQLDPRGRRLDDHRGRARDARGYGLARSRFRGKDHVAFWIISTRMAPIAAAVLPLFVIFRATHLLGTTWGLVVAYLSFNLPFAIWIMNAFFADLPPSLEEAAMVDGASRWTAFRKIACRSSCPGSRRLRSCASCSRGTTTRSPRRSRARLADAADRRLAARHADRDRLGPADRDRTIVVAPMIVVGLVVRKWLVTGLTLGAVTGE